MTKTDSAKIAEHLGAALNSIPRLGSPGDRQLDLETFAQRISTIKLAITAGEYESPVICCDYVEANAK